MTDAWDPSIPEHRRIAHGIEVCLMLFFFLRRFAELIHQVGDGIAEMRNVHAARKALKAVGFKILHEEDLAARKSHLYSLIPPEP